jgi:hypothetical protein
MIVVAARNSGLVKTEKESCSFDLNKLSISLPYITSAIHEGKEPTPVASKKTRSLTPRKPAIAVTTEKGNSGNILSNVK